jgi:hypothetical protein
MRHHHLTLSLAGLITACGLAGCGGGDSAGIGGTVVGLDAGESITLQDNNTDSLTLAADGPFRFATALSASATYSVTILTQPTGQVCQVVNGTGQVDSSADSITSVTIACITTSSLGGTVSGLAAGTAVILSNGTVLLPVATNGPFAFPDVLAAGAAYNVAVATQPLGQTCSVTNGVGVIGPTSTTAVTVTCSSN